MNSAMLTRPALQCLAWSGAKTIFHDIRDVQRVRGMTTNQGVDLTGNYRPTRQKALDIAASGGVEAHPLRFGLDAFGEYLHS